MKTRQLIRRLGQNLRLGRHTEPVLLLPPKLQQPIRVARALYLRDAIKRHWAANTPPMAAA